MTIEPSLTITKKLPYNSQALNRPVEKKPLRERLDDVKEDMLIRVVKKHLDQKYLKEDAPPSDLNNNMQHGI